MRLTEHTLEQMGGRGIAPAWVEETVAAPEWTEPDPIPGRTRLFRAIPGFGGRVLRVVVEPEGDDLAVATVHLDRNATTRKRRRRR